MEQLQSVTFQARPGDVDTRKTKVPTPSSSAWWGIWHSVSPRDCSSCLWTLGGGGAHSAQQTQGCQKGLSRAINLQTEF